jgi:peptidoglycan/xylan/chitin deacetylase (PgdA/CDA1 family)
LFPDEMHAARFNDLCRWLSQWFRVLPLGLALRQMDNQSLPSRALAITFDDGYSDNHDVALPILRNHGLSATFFVSTGFLNGGRMWNDTLIEAVRRSPLEYLDLTAFDIPTLSDHGGSRRLPLISVDQKRDTIARLISMAKYMSLDDRHHWTAKVAAAARAELPNDLMMGVGQVQALHRAGMTVGGHTVNHPILARLVPDEVRLEIENGRKELQSMIQAPVTLFAYPNGKPGRDYLPEHPAMVRAAGFEAAVTTGWGAARAQTDRFQLPRFTPWDRTRWGFGLRMARNLREPLAA